MGLLREAQGWQDSLPCPESSRSHIVPRLTGTFLCEEHGGAATQRELVTGNTLRQQAPAWRWGQCVAAGGEVHDNSTSVCLTTHNFNHTREGNDGQLAAR